MNRFLKPGIYEASGKEKYYMPHFWNKLQSDWEKDSIQDQGDTF